MDNHLHEFIRISIFRMCEHYLPKLKIILNGIDKGVLWKHEKETLNSIGGIVLHVGQHIQRHVIRYTNDGKIEGGIENYFPDEADFSSLEVIQLITDHFNAWREVMTDYLDGHKDDKILDMFDIYHLVEHTGYHLGQIIDRVQRLTNSSFQFVQNGINEKSLKGLIYRS